VEEGIDESVIEAQELAAAKAAQAPAVEAEPEISPESAADIVMELQARLDDADLIVADASNRVKDAQRIHQAAVEARDRIVFERDRMAKKQSKQAPVMAHLARQRQLATERAARVQGLREAGLGNLVSTKSPLDSAMARKTSRGGQRPNVGPMFQTPTQE